MRQELGTRVTELETAQSQQKAARDELDRVAHELDIKARSVESLTHDFQEQTVMVQQLQAEKGALEQQVAVMKERLEQVSLCVCVSVCVMVQQLQAEKGALEQQVVVMKERLEQLSLCV